MVILNNLLITKYMKIKFFQSLHNMGGAFFESRNLVTLLLQRRRTATAADNVNHCQQKDSLLDDKDLKNP